MTVDLAATETCEPSPSGPLRSPDPPQPPACGLAAVVLTTTTLMALEAAREAKVAATATPPTALLGSSPTLPVRAPTPPALPSALLVVLALSVALAGTHGGDKSDGAAPTPKAAQLAPAPTVPTSTRASPADPPPRTPAALPSGHVAPAPPPYLASLPLTGMFAPVQLPPSALAGLPSVSGGGQGRSGPSTGGGSSGQQGTTHAFAGLVPAEEIGQRPPPWPSRGGLPVHLRDVSSRERAPPWDVADGESPLPSPGVGRPVNLLSSSRADVATRGDPRATTTAAAATATATAGAATGGGASPPRPQSRGGHSRKRSRRDVPVAILPDDDDGRGAAAAAAAKAEAAAKAAAAARRAGSKGQRGHATRVSAAATPSNAPSPADPVVELAPPPSALPCPPTTTRPHALHPAHGGFGGGGNSANPFAFSFWGRLPSGPLGPPPTSLALFGAPPGPSGPPPPPFGPLGLAPHLGPVYLGRAGSHLRSIVSTSEFSGPPGPLVAAAPPPTPASAAAAGPSSAPPPAAPPPHRQCANCLTVKTPFWRKDARDGRPLCNACGLFARKNDAARPRALYAAAAASLEGLSGGGEGKRREAKRG